jgi:hypothetical protein
MPESSRQPLKQGDIESCPETQQLDLRDSARYTVSIEWIRNNVVLRRSEAQVLQLNVSLPIGAATLFMDPANHYIMAFRGADKVYVLQDNRSEAFKKALELRLRKTPIEILKGLGANHGLGGLETFSQTRGRVDGRIFSRTDLDSAAAVSNYSSATRTMTYGELRARLSLLVCMISESARIPMMERDFSNMLYYGQKVWADDAIRSFATAKFLIQLALRTFPGYPRHLAVEKLEKRASEMRALVGRIETVPGFHNRATLVDRLVNGKVSPVPPIADAVSRFRDMCKELKIVDPSLISQMMSACKSEDAVRAAKQGVAIPDIGMAV